MKTTSTLGLAPAAIAEPGPPGTTLHAFGPPAVVLSPWCSTTTWLRMPSRSSSFEVLLIAVTSSPNFRPSIADGVTTLGRSSGWRR